jgi:hypothetical protein
LELGSEKTTGTPSPWAWARGLYCRAEKPFEVYYEERVGLYYVDL